MSTLQLHPVLYCRAYRPVSWWCGLFATWRIARLLQLSTFNFPCTSSTAGALRTWQYLVLRQGSCSDLRMSWSASLLVTQVPLIWTLWIYRLACGLNVALERTVVHLRAPSIEDSWVGRTSRGIGRREVCLPCINTVVILGCVCVLLHVEWVSSADVQWICTVRGCNMPAH